MVEPARHGPWYQRGIRALQLLSVLLMWMFLGAAVTWMVTVVRVARSLGDALTASVWISLLAASVYTLVASVLTYVYFGLQRGRRREGE